MLNKTEIISAVCAELAIGNNTAAQDLLCKQYPFRPIKKKKRQYTLKQMMEVFVRDGFIDRYTNERLVFPGSLRLISYLLPEAFPYHPHGHMEIGHIAFWELLPTIDHKEPLARGGEDILENWICTSMLRNQIKANWTVDELGWKIYECGNLSDWDGLLSWFFNYLKNDKPLLASSEYLKKWWKVVQPYMA